MLIVNRIERLSASLERFLPRISCVGVGGAGGNAINHMITSGLEGVNFVACNTDAQALSLSLSDNRIQLGRGKTRGLGSGANPDVGRESAEAEKDQILNSLKHSHLCFLTAGMGGGTGSGATPGSLFVQFICLFFWLCLLID